jgi:hypothetical protein
MLLSSLVVVPRLNLTVQSTVYLYSRLLSVATEELILHLIKVKCSPILLYCVRVCDLTKATVASLDFCVMRFGFRIFRTDSCAVVSDCCNFFNFCSPSDTIALWAGRFVTHSLS